MPPVEVPVGFVDVVIIPPSPPHRPPKVWDPGVEAW